MKKRVCSLLLALALPLSGCQAMLEREVASVQPHTQSFTAREDPSALEAENYQELVSAVLYLVTQHTESGIVRLYNYTGDVENDLTAACLEVVQKDPLGAFAVDYIKHEVTRIVSYYEASVSITYRRTAEEMGQVVSVTGSSAIKSELRNALSDFDPTSTLRVSYFAEDDEYLRSLIRQAYYDTPLAAFGMPQIELALYPDSGIRRIVEIGLTYPGEVEDLASRRDELAAAVGPLLAQVENPDVEDLYHLLLDHVDYDPDPALNTAYDALTGGAANGEGLALAYKLLCDSAGLTCTVVQGQDETGPRYWNIVTTASGSRHVDAAAGLYGLTDVQLMDAGSYQWDSSYPICRDGSELTRLPGTPDGDPDPKAASAAETEEDFWAEPKNNA